MATTPKSKLNVLYTELPAGSPLNSAALAAMGISADLAVHYARSGWLVRLARGVYCRPGEALSLHPSLLLLQRQIAGLHVGGKTALDWYGVRQYAAQQATLHLYGWDSARLPDWFVQHFTSRRITANGCSPKTPGTCLTSRPSKTGTGEPRPRRRNGRCSSCLSEVGVRQPLQEATEIAEGAYNLRAEVLMDLLKLCTSVKTVRLCLKLGARARCRGPASSTKQRCPKAAPGRGSRGPGTACWCSTMNPVYLDTARLLIQVAPLVFADDRFALKGGTAINLFPRDMPRLSVDLDLVFVDHRPDRDEALAQINAAVRTAADRLRQRGLQTYAPIAADAGATRLFVRRDKIVVKVEVNFVLRGTVHPPRPASLVPAAKQALLADLELPVASPEDVYGGKLVAAMDRQHPRDLFDVLQLFDHEGITPGIRRSFVVYLACHNRPVHEVLFPALRDVAGEYDDTFLGMTAQPVALATLLSARERMVAELATGLDSNERAFLLSLSRNEPDFSLLNIEHLEQLPGIRWKLTNLERLAKANPKKFREQAQALERLLSSQ